MVRDHRLVDRTDSRWGNAMDITLRPVTRANFSAVIELTVTPKQAELVAANLYSIAEAAVESTMASMPCAGARSRAA